MNGHSACGNLEADEEVQEIHNDKDDDNDEEEEEKKKKKKKRKRIITGGFCEYGKSF
ncbi:hypothetical protein [Paenibacillus amylolyticus]|uniref:hypothetical protein n=1 Tax=Paenibacillus amylolyticus TaxID=1451 RepID=UPI003EBBE366